MRLSFTAAVVAVGLCLIIAGVARADVTGRWQVNLIRGSTTIEQPTGTTEAEAWDKCQQRIDVLSDSAAVNTVYACQTMRYYGTTIAAPRGTALLKWTPPTQNTDGTAMTNLAGYRISYGISPTALDHTIQIANPGLTSYTVTDLAPGTYFLAVRAYTSGGTESLNSTVVSKVIQ